jgi:D-alanyl-lipoteichoic acid acyltransferase DltB (MBOAT superfamily)
LLFNSIDFAIFLPLVFIGYWFIFNKNLRTQNLFLLVISYIFYGWWDPRFLILILFSTIVDFWIGNKIYTTTSTTKSKRLLLISILANLGLLGFFKYFNFFQENLVTAFTFFGEGINMRQLNIILPFGISFYTFQTLSYTIDIYRKKLTPSSNFIEFGTFVSFFPQLVAGPIERAANMLPQIKTQRLFNYHKAIDGTKQILWGLVKKIVIADNLAPYVTYIFENHEKLHASTLLLGAFMFAFQIYGDFSGYSDIAIGISRLFGFNLQQNFAFPYFSRTIPEFWRRWHISLSTWIRDYLYIPLGGNRSSIKKQIINIFILFVLSGFWHGANWTFIFWGALNALYFLPSLFNSKITKKSSFSNIPQLSEVLSILSTFSLITLSLILFRSETLSQAFTFFKGLFQANLLSIPQIFPLFSLATLFSFIIIEWNGRSDKYALETLFSSVPKYFRFGLYYILIAIIYYSAGTPKEYIYFQF